MLLVMSRFALQSCEYRTHNRFEQFNILCITHKMRKATSITSCLALLQLMEFKALLFFFDLILFELDLLHML